MMHNLKQEIKNKNPLKKVYGKGTGKTPKRKLLNFINMIKYLNSQFDLVF